MPLPHLLLVNLGTPDAPTPESVRRFLDEFLSDPDVIDFPKWLWQPILQGIILRTRPKKVAHAYESIWTPDGSPLRTSTERIVARLRAESDGQFTVSAAYRYGEPSIASEKARLKAEGVAKIVVVPLFPQRTSSTTGTAFRRAFESAVALQLDVPVIDRVIPATDPGYIQAQADRYFEAIADEPAPPDHIVISYHGIPECYDRNERRSYSSDCCHTTTSLLEAIRWPVEKSTLTFQSKFGPERWLTPATDAVLEALPARGVKSVAVITPGFVTDGLETIEEIGDRGRESFLEAGGERFIRVAAVDTHPAFIRSLAQLAVA
ncbi:MAG TPA: ferrochelatase [Gemmatimonadaceae bacterium]|nr:ferrochelatase [Gemmatimonadaceae bacterium]